MGQQIRVFWSALSGKFYATGSYKEDGDKVVVTGKKYDVTQAIASAIMAHELSFTEKKTTEN